MTPRRLRLAKIVNNQAAGVLEKEHIVSKKILAQRSARYEYEKSAIIISAETISRNLFHWNSCWDQHVGK